MPRKVTAKLQRTVKPDRKYNSVLVQKLINKSMLNGKKEVAEKAVYGALEMAARTLKSDNPLEVFEKTLIIKSSVHYLLSKESIKSVRYTLCMVFKHRLVM